MELKYKSQIVKIKNKNYKISYVLKGYIIERINVHNIICAKKSYVYINKYKRYESKKFKNLSVFNSTDIKLEPNMKVLIGYLGKKVTPTKSHTILDVIQ